MTPDAPAKHGSTASSLAVVVLPDPNLLAESTASRLLLAILDAQSVSRPVHVVLTGGTGGHQTLTAALRSPLIGAVDWSGVHVWWGDERFLPTGDPDRNETQAREALLDHLPLPADHVHAIPGPDLARSPEDAAEAYAAELARFSTDGRGEAGDAATEPADESDPTSPLPATAVPAFDLVMLGVGPDGHVASLFPGMPGVRERRRAVVGVHHSPKPPPERVSLTLPAIGQAREVWLIASGQEKAERIGRALSGRAGLDEVPASAVSGRQRTLWLLDAAAADAAPAPARTFEGGRGE